MLSRLLATFLVSALVALPVSAQTAPPTAPPAVAAADAAAGKKLRKPRAARTQESLACSAEADQKGLKGPERRKFHRGCIGAARKRG